ncbi:MAG: ABC transporter ATP-binding protein [Oscillospiraceae bacterium]
MGEEILRMEGITKIYSNGIMANKEVDFSVCEGEIHALMGENGAGKSTLMNILFGEQTADEGKIFLNGKEVSISTPTEAIKLGIGMVHQHFMLVPSLTVAENIFLGMEPVKGLFVDRGKVLKTAKELAVQYNFDVDQGARIADISVGSKQKVEILKALARGAKILILDEPTAVLTPQETEELFKELLLLKQAGHTIIFISHKLKEIKQICDRITIMKRGRSMGMYSMQDMAETDISRLMVGRDVATVVEKTPPAFGGAVMEMKRVFCYEDGKPLLKNINLRLRAGEIMGVAAVEGNGQQELMELVVGLKQISGGQILVNGGAVQNLTVGKIRKKGVAYVSADRIGEGTARDASIEDNLMAGKLAKAAFSAGPMLKKRAIHKEADSLIQEYQIVCDSAQEAVSMLSGGNMQKVVIAREFSGSPSLVLANQPTRGVDVGASEFIHQKLVQLRGRQAAVLLVSADLSEVIGLSDSIIVLYGGEIVAYFENTANISEEEIGFYMLGVKTQPQQDIARRMQHAENE